MAKFLGALFVILLIASSGALGQDDIYRTANVAAGQAVRIAVFSNVSKECTLGPLPELSVTAMPKQGTLVVKRGKVRAGTIRRCPDLSAPVQAAFYQAKTNFVGTDEVVLSVKVNGQVRKYTIAINIRERAVPNDKQKPVEL